MPEEVYIFKDESQPYRKLKVVTGVQENQGLERMSQSSHLHPTQAQETFVAGIKECWAQWHLKSLVGSGASYVVSMPEYKQKLKKKMGEHGDHEEQQRPKMTRGRTFYEKSEEQTDEDEEADDDDDGDDKNDMGDAASSHRSAAKDGAGASDHSPGPGVEKGSPASLLSTPPPKQALKSAKSFDRLPTKEFEEEDVSVSESVAKFINKPDGQLSEEQLLQKHLAKTPVMKALEGKPLGVKRKFAGEAVRKLGSTLGAQLKGHLALFDFARSLSPSEVGSLSNAELNEAVSALKGTVSSWPSGVQKAAHQRCVAMIMQRVMAEMRPPVLHELFDLIKPYSQPAETKQLDMLNPKLRYLDVPSAERHRMFIDLVIGELVVPVMQEGEGSAVKKFKPLVLEIEVVLRGWLLEEVPDELVPLMDELLTFSKGVQVLLLDGAFQQLPGVAAVNELRKHFRTVGSSPMKLLCNSLCETKYYFELVEACVKNTLKLKTNESRIHTVQAMNSMDLHSLELSDELVAEVLKAIKDMAFLHEEIELEAMAEMGAQALAQLQVLWGKVHHFLAAKGDDLSVNTVQIQELLMEGCIAFPQSEVATRMRTEMAEIMQAKAGVSRLQVMYTAFVDLLEAHKGGAADPKKIQDVHALITAARGLQLPEAMHDNIKAGISEMLLLMEPLFENEPVIFEMLYNLLAALAQFLNGDPFQKVHVAMKAALELQSAQGDFKMGLTDVASMVMEDGKLTKLAKLMRSRLQAQAPCEIEKEGAPWLDKVLQALVKSSGALVADAERLICTRDCQQLESIMAKVAMMAGGSSDGSLWHGKLSEKCSWPELLKQAEATIMKVDVELLESSRDQMEKVITSVTT